MSSSVQMASRKPRIPLPKPYPFCEFISSKIVAALQHHNHATVRPSFPSTSQTPGKQINRRRCEKRREQDRHYRRFSGVDNGGGSSTDPQRRKKLHEETVTSMLPPFSSHQTFQ